MKLPTPIHPYGKTVYLKVAGSEMAGMVTGYVIRPPNTLLYLVRWNDAHEDEHMEMELSAEREYTPHES